MQIFSFLDVDIGSKNRSQKFPQSKPVRQNKQLFCTSNLIWNNGIFTDDMSANYEQKTKHKPVETETETLSSTRKPFFGVIMQRAKIRLHHLLLSHTKFIASNQRIKQKEKKHSSLFTISIVHFFSLSHFSWVAKKRE